jgi:hypothetical protein
MVMVIAILAMLFIMGTTQLMVARYERKMAEQKGQTTQAKDTVVNASIPTAATTSEDLAGLNAIAYDGGWNTSDTSSLQDAGDFTGYTTGYTDNAQDAARSGDLLTASLEPFWGTDPVDPTSTPLAWRYYFMSWSKDTLVDSTPVGTWDTGELPGQINVASNTTPLVGSTPTNSNYQDNVTGEPCADADGDGIVDARWIGSVSGCDLYQRIIVHGGMVTMDRFTHPALLAQVIHPSDSYHSQPWALFQGTNAWNGTREEKGKEYRVKDEARLRRRFILPDSVIYNSTDWNKLPASTTDGYDLRLLLPYTLGYKSADNDSRYASHYWRVGSPPTEVIATGVTDGATGTDYTWWTRRMDPTYNNGNMYDRRHLLTTHNSDDLLRPIRDEDRLYCSTNANTTTEANLQTYVRPLVGQLREFYYLLNPAAEAGSETLGTATFAKQPINAYGMSKNPNNNVTTLQFNKPGLRTQFSLRDVTENGSATYRRAMQLTAYYLAMIQHTTVPGSNLSFTSPTNITEWENLQSALGAGLPYQLKTAAQLAVNTIDFADTDDIPTYFEWTGTDVGLGGAVQSFSVCGVEKQPYITEAYAKIVYSADTSSAPATWKRDEAKSLYAVELYNPYSTAISLNDYSLCVGTASSINVTVPLNSLSTTIPAWSYIVLANQAKDVVIDETRDFVGILNTTLFLASNLKITEGDSVRLVRNSDTTTQITASGNVAGPGVVVDEIAPSSLGGSDNAGGGWAVCTPPATTPAAGDLYVRDSSLQRHKDRLPTGSVYKPLYWHCTLSRQVTFPLKWQEDTANTNHLTTDASRVPVHNLLGATTGMYQTNVLTVKDDPSTMVPMLNQDIVAAAFEGRLLEGWTGTAAEPLFAGREAPIAPCPILIANRGNRSFPTTGSLLLVSRHAHQTMGTTGLADDVPASVTATKDLQTNVGTIAGNLQVSFPDNGHLPVITVSGSVEKATDLDEGEGQFDIPWGQLIFNYFTALPLEELAQFDFELARNYAEKEHADRYIVQYGEMHNYAGTYGTYTHLDTFPTFYNYPLVERETDAPSYYGARVRGRVNINYAPWWVLDGLPILPDQTAVTGPLDGLPVDELLYARLDGPTGVNRAGGQFTNVELDSAANLLTTENYPTIGAKLAKYLVSYRENRKVDGVDAAYTGAPGYTSVGNLCTVIPNVRFSPIYNNAALASTYNMHELRTYPSNLATYRLERPFSYVGYLQMIAPVVRLEDWATTKSHVYTAYNLVTDGQGTWLRSQTTFDRTRCLYSNDLPDKITQTEPLNYFNTVGDQQ